MIFYDNIFKYFRQEVKFDFFNYFFFIIMDNLMQLTTKYKYCMSMSLKQIVVFPHKKLLNYKQNFHEKKVII